MGISSDWGSSEKENVCSILTRVDMRLEGYKEKFLSIVGKEVLLKVVVQALSQNAISIFKIPLSICWAKEQKIAIFWRENSENRAGLHPQKKGDS